MASNTDTDPYKSGAISTSTNERSEVIQNSFKTPHTETFRIGANNLYLPVEIGAYDPDTGIAHEKFTDFTIDSANVLPKKRILIGYFAMAVLLGIAVILQTAFAGLIVSIAVIIGLGTTVFTTKALYQSSTAAAITLHINHHSATFIIEGEANEIQHLESLLTEVLETE